MEALIELRNVGKWYAAGRPVVQQVDLAVYRGQGLAIRGRNGSGKTTLLKLIAGITRPSAGAVRRAPELTVGYAPERFPPVRFRAEEYLAHLGRIRRIPKPELERRIQELMDLFQLHAAGPITHFSKGMTQKVNLMQAVLARPDVLVLDEPLSGLDADSQADFARLLVKFKQEGAAIVMTGHEPGFENAWADRTVVIRYGRLEELQERGAGAAAQAETSDWICNQWGVN
ncbi:ABC transporter-related protein [Thermobacillus xylanilyticus]|uniref:ABC transporter-related protein n=1 Tax=Thermobacillus xylanilyticus TaxID=76633 RepID=A0ABM8V4X8_THEXY|nr:ABC transporter ATP-binding protein [Thermobacillus xylanilyticus]CAG5087827.1 ABC transporter-related protein [Thermobacillus xylanilyticus]